MTIFLLSYQILHLFLITIQLLLSFSFFLGLNFIRFIRSASCIFNFSLSFFHFAPPSSHSGEILLPVILRGKRPKKWPERVKKSVCFPKCFFTGHPKFIVACSGNSPLFACMPDLRFWNRHLSRPRRLEWAKKCNLLTNRQHFINTHHCFAVLVTHLLVKRHNKPTMFCNKIVYIISLMHDMSHAYGTATSTWTPHRLRRRLSNAAGTTRNRYT